jgi:hypothetical protein
MHHFVRTQSFFSLDSLVLYDDSTLYDNVGHLIATKHFHFLDRNAMWIPMIEFDGDEPLGIVMGGRIYYIRYMCEHIEQWETSGLINEDQKQDLGAIINQLIYGKMGWDLNYHFPNTYMPQVSQTRLQSGNVAMFVDQFPSDPYSIIIDGTDSVTTCSVMSDSSWDGNDDVHFDWENLNDEIIRMVERDFQ